MIDSEKLAAYISAWNLEPSGQQFETHTSTLLPATRAGEPVMLKLTGEPDELRGAQVLSWWRGQGAVRVLEMDEGAVLMERAHGSRSLLDWSCTGQDQKAIDVLCAVTAELHCPRPHPRPGVVPLEMWFAPLLESDSLDPFVQVGRSLAAALLADPRDQVILHGDVHHRNVLDAGDGRWVAIDPKGLSGERTFDYVNMFRNPNIEIAGDPGRFHARVRHVSDRARLEPRRLLGWIAAFCALSIAWNYYPDGSPEHDRTVGELALALLTSAD
jgi:streptomycin 6-kinase